MSDKRYHKLHEWNESLEWKHGESLSIVPSNYRTVLVSFVTKAVLGDLGVLSEHSERAREEVFYDLRSQGCYSLKTAKSHERLLLSQ